MKGWASPHDATQNRLGGCLRNYGVGPFELFEKGLRTGSHHSLLCTHLYSNCRFESVRDRIRVLSIQTTVGKRMRAGCLYSVVAFFFARTFGNS